MNAQVTFTRSPMTKSAFCLSLQWVSLSAMPPKKRRNSQTGEVKQEDAPSPSSSSGGVPQSKRRRKTTAVQYDAVRRMFSVTWQRFWKFAAVKIKEIKLVSDIEQESQFIKCGFSYIDIHWNVNVTLCLGSMSWYSDVSETAQTAL